MSLGLLVASFCFVLCGFISLCRNDPKYLTEVTVSVLLLIAYQLQRLREAK